jgi:NADH dehydrogenase
MEPAVPHVVILGGGFGGLDAARALAHAPVRITLVDRHNYHVFQPLLYQVATAALSPADIASPLRWILRRQQNARVLMAEVRGIDLPHHRVLLGPTTPAPALDGAVLSQDDRDAISFDYLIVATGAADTYFGHPEWASRAPGLKTLDDALEIRRQMLLAFENAEREGNDAAQRRMLTFVIVGAGPTGVELAGALAEIARLSLKHDFRNIRPESAKVVLVEGGPAILASFPADLQQRAYASLERLGVDIRTHARVTGMDEEGVWIGGTQQTGGERISAQTVLWAAGVEASPIARSLGAALDRAGRAQAEPTLTIPGHPNVFVVGDICALTQDGVPLPGVAQVAIQEGRHAAANIVRAIRQEPLVAFRYRNRGQLAVIGRGAAVADLGTFRASGMLAWLLWIFIHLFWLIGFRNRLAVMTEWAWTYFTWQGRVRLITDRRDRGRPPGPQGPAGH